MPKKESLEDFYKKKYDWLPKKLRSEIGHFNLFPLEPLPIGTTRTLPYRRRDYYKVMLVLGAVDFHYADSVISVQKQALVFSNPHIPYKVEHLERIEGGYYCIFNQHFFHQFGDIKRYAVFQPTGNHVFELSDEQVNIIQLIYQRMFKEFDSDYTYKYDVLRNLVFEILHFAMKMQPASQQEKQPINAAQRITTLFLELLERQFPIEDDHPQVKLRTASDFAQQLNIHVNHLNRSVKATTQKTTSTIIAERIVQEAKILLTHSSWNVSQIAYALGFTEATHFNNFFKKHSQFSPTQFRSL